MLVGLVGTGNMGRPEVVGESSVAKALRAGLRGAPGTARQLGGSLGYRSPSRERLLTFLDQSVATLEIAVAD